MKAIFKRGQLILVPQEEEEARVLETWRESHDDHMLHVRPSSGAGLALQDLGPRPEACREPLNISSRNPDPLLRLIGNFSHTPFELDGETFQSVEGFWQSLKFDEQSDRRRVAALDGAAAKRAGEEQGYGPTCIYQGRSVLVGCWQHWELMRRACRAKFTQHADAQAALLSTGDRPLEHRMRRDSRTIPGVIMAEIWMEIRRDLRGKDREIAGVKTAK
jgi:predicted NAD-dependent protein-ADP-ribosyltransferase YbiA (DUF1768 family)